MRDPIRIDGKEVAKTLTANLKYRIAILKKQGITPCLTIVTSGNDAASQTYVRNKVRRAEEFGIKINIEHFDRFNKEDLIEVCKLNTPLIIQEPITGNVTHKDVAQYINPEFDVDGFSIENKGRLAIGENPYFTSCTPMGVMLLLLNYNIELDGKKVCIIGRSNIVGRPLSCLMEQKNATVTLCHSHTDEKTLYKAIQDADIVVSAVGKPEFITKTRGDIVTGYLIQWDKKVFIDVGINRDKEGHLCGDFSKSIYDYSHAYTPVPGGVGPMTVTMLMNNVVCCYEKKLRDKNNGREG